MHARTNELLWFFILSYHPETCALNNWSSMFFHLHTWMNVRTFIFCRKGKNKLIIESSYSFARFTWMIYSIIIIIIVSHIRTFILIVFIIIFFHMNYLSFFCCMYGYLLMCYYFTRGWMNGLTFLYNIFWRREWTREREMDRQTDRRTDRQRERLTNIDVYLRTARQCIILQMRMRC